MCGLFCVLSDDGRPLSTEDVARYVALGRSAQRRGSDASGMVVLQQDHAITVVKSNLGFGALSKSAPALGLIGDTRPANEAALLGHSRLETHGYSGSAVNNQPVVLGDWLVLHNGIIVNHRSIRAEVDVDAEGIESDTVAIALLLVEWDRGGRSTPLDQVFARLEGELSVIAVSTRGDVLCHTNVGNLYRVDDGGRVLLASEPRQFPAELRDRAARLELHRTLVLRQPGEPGRPIRVVAAEGAKDTARGAEGLHLSGERVDPRFAAMLEDVSQRALARAASLRRCRTCVLPDSFPGIEFDASGQCSICNTFVPHRYAGLDALAADLRAASPDGRTVLVCLSGGRDSCYVHHLVKELGFDPIAYTYDWGMVTTAARENMARMCGILETEHVLVSPDIRKNRQRIRRALTAWLKHPRVGTIPILMAGDKPYFRYAGIVSRERGGLPAVMADHPLETTGFKSMLAGARPTPSAEGGVSYRLSKVSLARMIGSYVGHAFRSPGLFPSLAMEGSVGFVDYYLRDHNFVRPFSYIPWDEDELETTLRGKYGWSAGEDRSATSWRMGDGTAPFYNLMYLISLGMTEHDALRANQVRFGMTTREEALAKLQSDNRMNVLGVASYFATVGIDPMWAAERIVRFADSSSRTKGPESVGDAA